MLRAAVYAFFLTVAAGTAAAPVQTPALVEADVSHPGNPGKNAGVEVFPIAVPRYEQRTEASRIAERVTPVGKSKKTTARSVQTAPAHAQTVKSDISQNSGIVLVAPPDAYLPGTDLSRRRMTPAISEFLASAVEKAAQKKTFAADQPIGQAIEVRSEPVAQTFEPQTISAAPAVRENVTGSSTKPEIRETVTEKIRPRPVIRETVEALTKVNSAKPEKATAQAPVLPIEITERITKEEKPVAKNEDKPVAKVSQEASFVASAQSPASQQNPVEASTFEPVAVVSAQEPQPSEPAVEKTSTAAPVKLVPPTAGDPGIISKNMVEALVSDSLILDAYRLSHKNDVGQLEKLAQKTARHPLNGYVKLWAINARAARETTKGSKLSAATGKAYKNFIAEHEGQYLAERARTDWARAAARSNDGTVFEQIYPTLRWNKNETDISCLHALFSLQKTKSATRLAEAKKEILRTRAAQIDACKNLAREVLQADPKWNWSYVLILMQKKRFKMVREFLAGIKEEQLPIRKSELTQILNNPDKWYVKHRNALKKVQPRVLLFASLRMLPKDFSAAVKIASATDGRISASAAALLWGRVGYEAALNQVSGSLKYYRKAGSALNASPRSTLIVSGDQLLLWRARAALREGTPRETLEAIAALPADLRTSAAWIYWRASMLEKTGQKQKAHDLYRSISSGTEFYNLLACDALGIPYTHGDAVLTPPAKRESFIEFSKNASLLRAIRFYKLELYSEGHREWNWAMANFDSRKRLELAEYAGILGLPHRQINTSQSSGRIVFNQLYPKPHVGKISSAARQAGLPEAWVYGLIRQESRFISVARSSVGALGLMQVMPKTARWVAKKAALNDYREGNLAHVDTNLLIGTQYLKLVTEKVSPNMVLASASYNAGPSRALAWRSTLVRDVPGAVFAETIPFGETRDYVMRVTANTVQYSRYEDSPLRLTDILETISPEPLNDDIIP